MSLGEKLSKKIINFIGSEIFSDNFYILEKKYKLAAEQLDQLMSILEPYYLKEKKIVDLSGEIKNILPLPDANFIADVYGYIFFPLQDYIGSVREYIKKYGGNMAAYEARAHEMFSPRNFFRYDFDDLFSGIRDYNLTVVQEDKIVDLIVSVIKGLRSDNKIEPALIEEGFEPEKAKAIAEEAIGFIKGGYISREDLSKLEERLQNVLTATPGRFTEPGAEEEKPASAPKNIGTTAGEDHTFIRPGRTTAGEDHTFIRPGRITAGEEVLPASRAEAAVVDWDKMANDLIKESGMALPAELAGRLKSAVLSGLKGIRKMTDLKEVLTREREIGGLGMRMDEAEKIAKLISNFKFPISNLPAQAGQVQISKSKNVETQDFASQNKNNKPKKVLPIAEGAKKENIHIFDEEELEHELGEIQNPKLQAPKEDRKTNIPPPPTAFAPQGGDAAGKPVFTPTNTRTPASQLLSSKMKEAESRLAGLKLGPDKTSPQPSSILPRVGFDAKREGVIPPQLASRPINAVAGKVTDIKRVQKLVGPIDELKRFTIVDFRRLGNDPRMAMARIIEKINLLAEESFAKKVQAIKAFQQSQLYRTYLQMGQESIGQGINIEGLIDKNQKAGVGTLSKDEFFAIMEAGDRLRF